jgi:hypothetical protein
MPSLRNSSSSSSVNRFLLSIAANSWRSSSVISPGRGHFSGWRGTRFISSEFYTLIRGTKLKLVLAERRVADSRPRSSDGHPEIITGKKSRSGKFQRANS